MHEPRATGIPPESSEGIQRRLLQRARHLLSSPKVSLAAAALGMLLSLPSVKMGLAWDDLLHRMLFTALDDSVGAQANPWVLPQDHASRVTAVLMRTFIRTDPSVNARLRERGELPWWSVDSVRIAHFRPLSALTHWWDHLFWDDRAVPMHLENVLLYGLACLLAAHLFRRIAAPPWAAGLAALVFAADARHLVALGWIASRNGVLALVFGLLALLAHDRWRREHWTPGALAAPLCLALSAASAELGVSTGAFLLAYELFLDAGPWRRRLLTLLPSLLVGAAWIGLYEHWHYGALSSGLYVDPIREPGEFLRSMVFMVPVMLFGQIGAADPVLYALLSVPARWLFWSTGVAFLLATGWVGWKFIGQARDVKFWAAGMGLSALLVAGNRAPMGRMLLFVGLGAAPLIAGMLGKAAEGTSRLLDRSFARLTARAVCGWLLLLHLLFAPVHFLLRAASPFPSLFRLEPLLDFSAVPVRPDQDLIVVNAPFSFAFLYCDALGGVVPAPRPAHLRLLAPGSVRLTVTRIDTVTLAVRTAPGFFPAPGSTIGAPDDALPVMHRSYLSQQYDEAFRPPWRPVKLYERFDLHGMSAEVVGVNAQGRPSEVWMRFAVPLGSEKLCWASWDWARGRYIRFRPPETGGTVSIEGPPPDLPLGLALSDGGW